MYFPSWTQTTSRTFHDCKSEWKGRWSGLYEIILFPREAFKVIDPSQCKLVFVMSLVTFGARNFRSQEIQWIDVRNNPSSKSAPSPHSCLMICLHKEGFRKGFMSAHFYICRESCYLIPVNDCLTTGSGIWRSNTTTSFEISRSIMNGTSDLEVIILTDSRVIEDCHCHQ